MFFLSESGPAHRVLGVCIDKYAKCVFRHLCEVSLKQQLLWWVVLWWAVLTVCHVSLASMAAVRVRFRYKNYIYSKSGDPAE